MGNKVLPYKSQLVEILGPERVFFDEEVRKLYGHDISNPPKMLDLMVKRTPECVVVPGSKEQLVELLKWATAVEIPVTPRAAGTSAYGGSVPAKGGVTVDLRHFDKDIDVDADEKTVTVDPGVVILDLERALNKEGLMLPIFPTSAPAATIGGFVAQGGVGMGSFRHGPIADQVVAAEIVLPNGDVRTFRGRELAVVTDCEGITGIITKVTLRAVDHADKKPVLVTYKSRDDLAKGIDAFRRTNAWNLTFHNPTFSQLREEAGGAKTVPRKKYSILAVYRTDEYEDQSTAIDDAIESSGGERLDDEVAQKDWGEIFNTLRAKKLGPSIAPGEVVFPAESLAEFLAHVEDDFDWAEVSIEGTVILGGYITILAFALEDERRPEYPVGFSLGMNLLDVGKKLGGRAYAPGLYLASEAPRVFGSQRYDRIRDFKKAVDRSGIMNPGKIIGLPPRGAPPAPITPPFLNVDRQLNAKPAKLLMGAVAPIVRYLRPGDERFARTAQQAALARVAGGDFGSKHGWAVYTVSNSGYCGCQSPLDDAVGHEGGSVQGVTYWAKRYLQGQFEPDDYVTELVAAAAEVEWSAPENCIFGVDHKAVFRDFKRQLEADYDTELTVSDALRKRIEQAKVAGTPPPTPAPESGEAGDEGEAPAGEGSDEPEDDHKEQAEESEGNAEQAETEEKPAAPAEESS